MSQKEVKSELECPYCQDQIDNFATHVNGGFRNGESSKCSNCNLHLLNEQCVTSHVTIVHQNATKVFSCELCNIDFSSKKYLFIHKKLVSHKPKTKIEIEENSQENVDEFDEIDSELFEAKVEIKEETENDLFVNTLEENLKTKEQQSKIFPSKSKGFSHIFQGPQGAKKLNIKNHILENTKIQDAKKEYRCCGKVFENLISLKNHIEEVHQGARNRYSCVKCYQTFRTQNILDMHVSKSHDETEQSEYSSDNLKIPLEQVHTELRNFVCSDCNKTFKTTYDLRRHFRRVHSSIKGYQCEECPITIKYKDNLKKHVEQVHRHNKSKHKTSNVSHKDRINAHYNERKFDCWKCPRSFIKKSYLQAHVEQVHEGLRKYNCDQCDKNYKNSSSLHAHKKATHENSREFKCMECSWAFNIKEHLKQHVNSVHSNIKPYKCDGCDKSFKLKGYLSSHMNRYHKRIKRKQSMWQNVS